MFNITKFLTKPKIMSPIAVGISQQHGIRSFTILLTISEIQIICLLLEVIYIQLGYILTPNTNFIDERILIIARAFNLRNNYIYDLYFQSDTARITVLCIISGYLLNFILIFIIIITRHDKDARLLTNMWIHWFKMVHPYIASFYIMSWLLWNINFLFLMLYNKDHIVLNNYHYHDDKYSQVSLIIEAFIVIILIILNIIISIILHLIFAPVLKEQDLSGMKYSYSGMMAMFFKYACLILLIIPDHELKAWLFVIVLIIWTLIKDYLLFKDLYYYSIKFMLRITLFHGISTGIIISAIIGIIINISGYDYKFLGSITVPFISLYMIRYYRNLMICRLNDCLYKNKSLTESEAITRIILMEEFFNTSIEQDTTFKNINLNELYLNGFIHRHVMNCDICSTLKGSNNYSILSTIPNFNQFKLHVFEVLLEEALSNFPKSLTLNCMLMTFWLQMARNLIKSCLVIGKLKSQARNIKEHMLIYANSRKIEKIIDGIMEQDGAKTVSFVKFRDNEILFDDFITLILEKIHGYLGIWSRPQSPNPDLSSLVSDIMIIKKKLTRLNAVWKIYEKSLDVDFARPWLIYGIFLCWIKNAPERAKYYFSRYEKIVGKNQLNNLINEFNNKTIFSPRNVSVIVETQKEKFGQIISCSDSIETLLNHTASSLISKSINEIVPEFLREHHYDLMRRYYRHGDSESLNITRDQFCLHQKGFLIAIKLHVSIFPFIHNQIALLGMMREIKQKTHWDYIITTEFGDILGATENIFINCRMKRIKNKTMSILSLLSNQSLKDIEKEAEKLFFGKSDTPTTNPNLKVKSKRDINEGIMMNSSITNTKKDKLYEPITLEKSLAMPIDNSKKLNRFKKFADVLEANPQIVYIIQRNRNNRNRKFDRRSSIDSISPNELMEYEISCVKKTYVEEALTVRIFKLKCLNNIKQSPYSLKIESMQDYSLKDNEIMHPSMPTIDNFLHQKNNFPKPKIRILNKLMSQDNTQYINSFPRSTMPIDVFSDELSEHLNIRTGINESARKPYGMDIYNSVELKPYKAKLDDILPIKTLNSLGEKNLPEKSYFSRELYYMEGLNEINESDEDQIHQNASSLVPINSITANSIHSNLLDNINMIVKASQLIKNTNESIPSKTKRIEQERRKRRNNTLILMLKPSKKLKLTFYMGIIIALYSISSLFILKSIQEGQKDYIKTDSDIIFHYKDREMNILEIHRTLLLIKFIDIGLINNTRQNKTLFIDDYLSYLIDQNLLAAKNLITNNTYIYSLTSKISSTISHDFFFKSTKFYDVDTNGNPNENYTLTNSFEASNFIYNKIIQMMIDFQNITDEYMHQQYENIIMMLLYNLLNDSLTIYQSVTDILNYKMRHFVGSYLKFSLILSCIAVVLSLSNLVSLYLILHDNYITKKKFMQKFINIQPQLCSMYIQKLRLFSIALRDKWSDDKLEKLGKISFNTKIYSLNTLNNYQNDTIKAKERIVNTRTLKWCLFNLLMLGILYFAIIQVTFEVKLIIHKEYQANRDLILDHIQTIDNHTFNQDLAIISLYKYISSPLNIFNESSTSLILNQTLNYLANYQAFYIDFNDIPQFTNSQTDYFLKGNLCQILPQNSQDPCQRLGYGSALNGIFRLNSFIKEALSMAKNSFDQSNKTLNDSINILKMTNLIELEALMNIVILPAYGMFKELFIIELNTLDNYNNYLIIIWQIVTMILIILSIFICWIPIYTKLKKEKDALRYMINIMPASIAAQTKFMDEFRKNKNFL